MVQMKSKENLLSEMANCVADMEEEQVVCVAREYIESGYEAYDGINGLASGMNKAGERYEAEEYFVPELLICSDTMYSGMEVLKPYLKPHTEGNRCPVIMGVVEGDTHDIGKNLVKIMMETANFEIIDLGRDVPADKFIAKAQEVGRGIICLSTLMTTTMYNMKVIIDKLIANGIRNNFKIMVGGGPLSESFAEQIQADAYTSNALAAAQKAKIFEQELASL